MHKIVSLPRAAGTASLALALAFASAPAYAAKTSAAAAIVQEAPLRAHLAFLSSDLLEGRGTGQRGGDLAVGYLETEAMAAGLRPANGNSYRQSVKIAGVCALPQESSVALVAGGQPLPLTFGKDWVWAPGDVKPVHQMDAPLVFVGYGIQAPEEGGWDDYKGVDVKGKVLVMLVNDPQPTTLEPNRFNGKGLTYYGRWTYKFEEAARRGAAGVLLIHTDASASYGWSVVHNSWTAERFQLADADLGTGIQGWMTEATARALFSAAGQDLDQLRAQAEDKSFKPVVLNARVEGETKAAVRTLEQFNVAGIVPGTDPKLKDELVIYSAHWDHLGKQGDSANGADTIYNGAVDNASGSAGLLAMAQEAVRHPAKRSQMFLWVAAEEQGLLGSAAYAAHPLWPLNKTAAALNLDSLNFVAATKDIGVQGSERSDLGAMAASTAKSMGLLVATARPDLGGGYFRSDHFSFAKAGVPALYIKGGVDHVEKGRAYGLAQIEDYTQHRYHSAADNFDPDWDLRGIVQDLNALYQVGKTLSLNDAWPNYREGNPFRAIRDKSRAGQ
jgi:Zn-dependent M28 family amino/carboxypeptidase